MREGHRPLLVGGIVLGAVVALNVLLTPRSASPALPTTQTRSASASTTVRFVAPSTGRPMAAALALATRDKHPPAAAPAASGRTVTLHLHVNARLSPCRAAIVVTGPPPTDMPPGTVALTLPLFPGAVPITRCTAAVPAAPDAMEESPYVKADAAAFAVPISATTAVSWYLQTFAHNGYELGRIRKPYNQSRMAAMVHIAA